MPSIKISDLRGGEGRREELLKLLGENQFEIWKVEQGGDYLYVVVEEAQVDEFFQTDSTLTLLDNGFQIEETPDIKCLKTVVVRQVDCSYKSKPAESIMDSINTQNNWAEAVEASFLPTKGKYQILKIVFSKTKMAMEATRIGLKCFHQTIPPLYIEHEVQVKLTPCSRCYKYNHIRRDCSNQPYNRCTKCGSAGHNRETCNNRTFNCANCERGNHDTFSRDCPIRKQIIHEKGNIERNKERNRAADRYKQLVEYNRKVRIDNTTAYSAPKKEDLPAGAQCIILTALTAAAIIEEKSPGTFQATLTDIYKENKLPEVKIPQHIISQMTNTRKEPRTVAYPTEPMVFEEYVRPISKSVMNIQKQGIDEAQTASEPQIPGILSNIRKESKRMLEKSGETPPPLSQTFKMAKTQPDEPEPKPQAAGMTGAIYNKTEGEKKKEKEHDQNKKLLKTLYKVKATVYYPRRWQDREGRFNQKKVLDNLLQTKINISYENDTDGATAKDLIEECHKKNLNLSKIVTFLGVDDEDYNKLDNGQWSVVGFSSDGDDG